jgi:hypothetical protein
MGAWLETGKRKTWLKATGEATEKFSQIDWNLIEEVPTPKNSGPSVAGLRYLARQEQYRPLVDGLNWAAAEIERLHKDVTTAQAERDALAARVEALEAVAKRADGEYEDARDAHGDDEYFGGAQVARRIRDALRAALGSET